MATISDNVDMQMQILRASVGSIAAQCISRVNGALVRMEHGHFAQAVVRFRDAIGLTTPQLITVLGDSGVAANVESQGFVESVIKFKDALGLTTEQLVTIVEAWRRLCIVKDLWAPCQD